MTASTISLKRLFNRHLLICREADRLIDLGERAHADLKSGRPEKVETALDQLRTVGARLFKLSEGGALNDASAFYSALVLNHSQASRAQAEAILEGIASSGSALFRAKALAALGGNRLSSSDHQSAKEYYDAASQANPDSITVEFIIRSSQATMRSIAGDYRRALRDFEALQPLARHLAPRLPFYLVNLNNSLAVAHCDAGNLSEAEGYAREAINSPLAHPEFGNTLVDIAAHRERRNRQARLSEASRKAKARRELSGLLITPRRDLWQAVDLEAVLKFAREVRPR